MENISQVRKRAERLALFEPLARVDPTDQMKRGEALIELATFGKFKSETSRLIPIVIYPDRKSDEVFTRLIGALVRRGSSGSRPGSRRVLIVDMK